MTVLQIFFAECRFASFGGFMKKKIGLVVLLCTFAMAFVAANEEYSKLKEGAKSKTELLQKITEYENNHSKELEPKSDLALLYLSDGNYDKAEDYLKAGEKLIKKAKSPPEPFYVAQLYYTYGRFYYESKNNLQNAKKYADMAFAIEKEGEQFGYLKALIAAEMQNAEEAYEVFNLMYEKYPEKADGPSLTMFVQLAVFYEDFEKAGSLLDDFFEKHTYLPKIALWASQVYEKAGNLEKSIYCAYLVHEFASCYDSSRNEVFFSNLKNMQKIAVAENRAETLAAINNLLVLFEEPAVEKDSSSEEVFVAEQKETTDEKELDFIPFNYVQIKKKINNGTLNQDDVIKLTSYENNFKELPAYYWLLAQAVKQVSAEGDYAAAMSRIGYLSTVVDMGTSEYEKKSREEICDMCSIKEEDRGRFLSSREIIELCASYYEEKDQKKVDRILDSVSLTQSIYYNYYLKTAVNVIKRFKQVYPDFNKACNKWHKKNPDARMPLLYTLNF